MTDRDEDILEDVTTDKPTRDLNWDEEKTKVRVRQFMNILEQLPRLCSPTICGTLSQPTTRTERVSRGADMFEWSIEQKAILSPANITTDTDGTDDWQNVADLNLAWRQQESDMFFSQRTIAPSPLITTPSRALKRPLIKPTTFQDPLCDDDEEEAEQSKEDDDNNQEAQDLTTSSRNQSTNAMSFEFDDDHQFSGIHSGEGQVDHDDDDDDDDDNTDNDDDASDCHDDSKQGNQSDMMDNLFFSPQPLKSSQTQQRMDVFSPDTFSRVMEDENTLQSTPKTTGSMQRNRVRSRADLLD